MGSDIEDIELCFIRPDGDADAESSLDETVAQFFETKFDEFDVGNAQCYDPVQREQLLGIIEAGFGGLSGFNHALKGTMKQLRDRTHATALRLRAHGKSSPAA